MKKITYKFSWIPYWLLTYTKDIHETWKDISSGKAGISAAILYDENGNVEAIYNAGDL